MSRLDMDNVVTASKIQDVEQGEYRSITRGTFLTKLQPHIFPMMSTSTYS